ncbi:hypothetical protein KW805_01040 [Candidatus Pacearchaeota archaeon]|nr:hypothetical protein [Candidatus Pacearchaeota archaeon]
MNTLAARIFTPLISKIDHALRGPLTQIVPPKQIVDFYSRARPFFLDMLASINPHVQAPLQPVKIAGLTFRNDLMNAAGFDKDGDLLAINYLLGAGGAIVGTTLSHPHKGNLIPAFGSSANPWVPLPYSHSAINSLGLPSKGIKKALYNIEEFKWKYQPKNFPIILSIMEHPLHTGRDRLEELVKALRRALPIVDGIEINESCPNIKHNQTTQQQREKIKRLRAERDSLSTDHYVPIWYKLGNYGDIERTVEFFTELGADGIAGLNSQKNYHELENDVDIHDKQLFNYYTSKHQGGVTGRLIKKMARKSNQALAHAVNTMDSRLELTDIGGIQTWEDLEVRRTLSPKTKLYQWYTGLIYKLSSSDPENIYPTMQNHHHVH